MTWHGTASRGVAQCGTASSGPAWCSSATQGMAGHGAQLSSGWPGSAWTGSDEQHSTAWLCAGLGMAQPSLASQNVAQPGVAWHAVAGLDLAQLNMMRCRAWLV